MTVVTFTRTSELTLEILLREVEVELAQDEYSGRTHGRPATYAKGCRGHLCRYVERTRRRAIRTKIAQEGLPFGVVPDARSREEQRWDAVLASIVEYTVSPVDAVKIGERVSEQLDMRQMADFMKLMNSIRQGVAFIPHQKMAR